MHRLEKQGSSLHFQEPQEHKICSQERKGQKIGGVQIVCRFMVTFIKIFKEVLPLF